MTSKYIDNSAYAVSGYTLSGVFQSITIGPAGTIGGPGIVGGSNEAYTIVNHGRIAGTDTGVSLLDGGTVANAGTVLATGSAGIGVYIAGVGIVTNAANDLIEGTSGVKLGIGTLGNTGEIVATGTSGIGLYLLSGGVTNRTGGLIEGSAGIDIAGSGGSIGNAGTIDALAQENLTDDAIAMHGTGMISNAAGGRIEIIGTNVLDAAIYLAGGVLTNAGLIAANGGVANGQTHTGETAIAVSGTAIIQNDTAGLISAYGEAIAVQEGLGTIVNAGTIIGTYGVGITLAAGGTVTNEKGGLIESGYRQGVIQSYSAAATIFNAGTITYTGAKGYNADGIFLGDGGLIDNSTTASVIFGGTGIKIDRNKQDSSPATIINYGTIHVDSKSRSYGIFAYNGPITVANVGTTSFIEGYESGVLGRIGGQPLDLLSNEGTIESTGLRGGTGVEIRGSLINDGTAALITGFNGVNMANGAFTNSGRVLAMGQGTGIAVEANYLTLENLGSKSVIQGYTGVQILKSGTITNDGDILATGNEKIGIKIAGQGIIINADRYSVISGAYGVVLGAGTLDNFGTIVSIKAGGGTAVQLGAKTVLIDEAGSVFSGKVVSSGGGLELAGTGGTIAGLGSLFVSFGTVSVVAGARFTVIGSNTVTRSFADTGALTDNGVLTLSGTSVISGLISGTGTLAFSGGAATLAAGSELSVAHVSFFDGAVSLGHSLVDTGSFTQSNGTVSLTNNVLTLKGAASFVGGTVSGTGYLQTDVGSVLNALTLDGGAVWQTFGAVSATGSLILGDNGGGSGKLVVESGAAFEIAGDVGIGIASGGAGRVANVGLFEKTAGTGVSTIAASFNDTGTVAIASGTLDFTGGTNSIAGTVSGGGTLQFGAGATTLAAGTVLTVSELTLSGASVTLGKDLTYNGSFAQAAGSIHVTGYTLVLNGADTLTNGAINGAGFLGTYGAASVVNYTVNNGAVWQVYGKAVATGSVTLGNGGGGSGRLAVIAGGTYDITANGGIVVAPGGSGTVGNFGLFEKTGGTGISAVTPAFTNSSTILANSGALDLAGAVGGTGTATIGAAGALRFDSTVASTQTVAFAGTAGGRLALNDPSGSGLGFAGSVKGFGGKDQLDLTTFAFSGTPTIGWSQTSASSGTLTVTDGSKVAKITLFGQYAQSGFGKSQDSGTGTVIAYTPPAEVALANPHR